MQTVPLATALDLARCHWHVTGRAETLPSYLDENVRIRGPEGDFILKIAHPSWSRADLDLENRAMMTLAEREPQVEWPHVRLTANGEHLLTLPVHGKSRHLRMLRFVAGQSYAERVTRCPPRSRRALHESLGATVARLTRGLADFHHTAADRSHPWNLLSLPHLREEVAGIEDGALRRQVADVMMHSCTRLATWRERLPMCVVHNDPNDHNVIVTGGGTGNCQVRSIIDFGDMCTSFRMANLAIACTYAMVHEPDPAACARRIVHGYLVQDPLSATELSQLHAMVLARIGQSILMAVRGAREQPDNAYVAVSQHGLVRLLEKLIDIPADALVTPLPESCHE